jgi:hypothetical protein
MLFSCSKLHMMSYKDRTCKTCGEPCTYLDGFTIESWEKYQQKIEDLKNKKPLNDNNGGLNDKGSEKSD